MPNRSRQAWTGTALAALLAVASLFYFADKTTDTFRKGYFDLPLFTQAAIRYWRGEPVYQRSDDLENRYKPGAIVYKFPPPYLLHFVPWLDGSGKQLVWFGYRLTFAYIAIHAFTVFLVCRLLLRCRKKSAGDKAFDPAGITLVLLATAFSAVYMPYFLVQGGTSGEGFIAMLALLSLTLMRRWPLLAGFLLMWLACIKLYPAFLLLYPLLTRQWKVLLAAAVSALLIGVASLLVFGLEENRFYLERILPILLTEQSSEDWTGAFRHTTGNLGLAKVMVEYSLLPNRLPLWVNAVRLPFVFALMILLLKYCRQHDERDWTTLLGFALIEVTMLICLPNVFYAYFIILLFPALVLAAFLWQQGSRVWLLILALCMSCFLVDDKWTYDMAEQAGLFSPTPAITAAVEQEGGYLYLLQHHKLLLLLSLQGMATPFMPVVLWLMLALAIPMSAINRHRTLV